MADDPVTSSPLPGDSGGSQPAGGPAESSPKRRRRRRRSQSSTPSFPGAPRIPEGAPDLSLAQEEAAEALSEPRPSVRDMFSVSLMPDEARQGSEELVYEAPLYQAPQTPLPSQQVPPSNLSSSAAPVPLKTPSTDSPPLPPADPFSAYQSPFSVEKTSPSQEPVSPPPSIGGFDPFAPVPGEPSAPVVPPMPPEPSPYDLAASFASSPAEDIPSEVVKSSKIPEASPLALEEALPPEAPIESEIISPPASPEEPIEPVPPVSKTSEVPPLKGRLRELLAEANLTPRHFKFCCVGVLVVLLIIGLALWVLPRLLDGTRLGDDEEAIPENDIVENVSSDEVLSPTFSGSAWVDPSVYVGFKLGEAELEFVSSASTNEGLETGFLLGEESVESAILLLSQFQGFVTTLEDLYNLYFVDIQGLLDGSSDRAATLDEHIATLRTAYQGGAEAYEAIGALMATLKSDYDEVLPTKEQAEADFFVALDDFEGASAEEEFLRFVELKQTLVELKAEYLAFKELQSMHEKTLDALFPLIQDLETNREALISGVQVVDVVGSDLNLILTEEDLEE